MLEKNAIANEGGVNGTGKGLVNTNSADYKGLQSAILAHASQQTTEERISYHLIALKYQMQSYVSQNTPKKVRNVGDFLKEHLIAIGIKHKTFAKYVELETSNLSAILKGKRKINTLLAFKLGQIFSINPNLWLQIQSKNELLAVENKAAKIYRLDELLKVG